MREAAAADTVPGQQRRAPLPLRCYRLARLALHLLAGLAITTSRFPRLSTPRRHAEVRRWSKKLLDIFGVRVRALHRPAELPVPCMLVGNHISWLDMFLILAEYPAAFVAKAEIRAWPLAGRLCVDVGTLFIDRGNRRAMRGINAVVAAALRAGTIVSVYPEGTTTDGRQVGRFHAGLLQPAIDAGAWLVPVALRYTDPAGQPCRALDYVGDTTFFQTVWATASAEGIVAEMIWLPAVDCSGRQRRELAHQTQAAIAAALGSAAGAPSAPPTPP